MRSSLRSLPDLFRAQSGHAFFRSMCILFRLTVLWGLIFFLLFSSDDFDDGWDGTASILRLVFFFLYPR
jgi:hypothetical protein